MLRTRPVTSCCLVLASVLLPCFADAEEPFRYPEARHGKGELKYRSGLPVLTVTGTPAEIGAQVGILGAKPARRMLDYPDDLLKHFHVELARPYFLKAGHKMFNQFPADYRKELDAVANASGFDRDRLLLANTLFDVKKMIACSALLAEADHSTTGGPLFGRNLDYPSLGYAERYSLVTVYRPDGKHAFASIGFPGLIGCLSGMNDAGLALGVLEVFVVSEPSERFNAAGVPYAQCYRRILEECTTVDEAEKLLRSLPRTTTTNLAICDRRGGAVFEVTPKQVVVRRPENGVEVCTNHFCSAALKLAQQPNLYKTLDRYEKLDKLRDREKLGVADLHKGLDAANQGDHTLQTMIFEPAALRLHLAIGKAPSSAQELKTLDLAGLLGKDRTDK